MRRLVFALAVSFALVSAACSSSSTDSADSSTSSTDSDFLTIVPSGTSTSAPASNSAFLCQFSEITDHSASWILDDGTLVDLSLKPTVPGAVSWDSELSIVEEGDTRRVVGNGLPTNPTGEYPIPADSEAAEFDRNPNAIQAQNIDWSLPLDPEPADEPSCLGQGAIAIALTGSVFFNQIDADGIIAAANEILDDCRGHPAPSGQYHYHSDSPSCLDHGSGDSHSPLVGYALDGFGIYGRFGEGGAPITNDDLDECHGHTGAVETDSGDTGATYHYHTNSEFPFVLGCYTGTPIEIALGGGGAGGGPPPGG